MALATTTRYILAAEFLLGGQARLTPAITPATHEMLMDKAPHFFKYIPHWPVRHPQTRMQQLGAVMLLAAAWLAIPAGKLSEKAQRGAFILAGTLSTTLLIGEIGMAGNVWLPAVNLGAAGWLLYDLSRKPVT